MPASGTELPSGRFGPVLHGGGGGAHGRIDVRRIGMAIVAVVGVVALFALGTAGALIVVSQRSIDQIELGNVGDQGGEGDQGDGGSGTDDAPAGGGAVPFDEVTEPTNILVVGTDSRENLTDAQLLALGTEDGGGNLTDTIMLVQLDPRRDTAALLSFPRDLYVTRCNGTKGKINAAFAIGEAIEGGTGPECLVETIEDFTDIPIDHYVQVDLAGFINAVDAIGGVTFYVQEPLRDVAAGLDIDAGCVHFDGTRALGFVRARNIDSDFGRIARQQRFLREMVDKVTSAGVLLNPVRLFSLVREVSSALTTDSGLGLSTQRDLAFSLRNLTAQGMDTRTVPGDIRKVDDASVVVADEERAELLFEAFRKGTVIPEDPGATTPTEAPADDVVDPDGSAPQEAVDPDEVGPLVVRNGVGTTGLATRVSTILEQQGFSVASTQDAERFGVTRTRVLYAPDMREDAEAIAAALAQAGVDARLVPGADVGDLTIVVGEDLDPDDMPTALSSSPDGRGQADPATTPLPPAETPDFSGAQVSTRTC